MCTLIRQAFTKIAGAPYKEFHCARTSCRTGATILNQPSGEKRFTPPKHRLVFSSKRSFSEQSLYQTTKYNRCQPQVTFSKGLCTFEDDDMADNKFCADYDKRGMAACKKCKQKLTKGQMRLGKVTVNPFSGDSGGDMKLWHHPQCLFDTFLRARATTKVIEDPSDVEGFNDLQDEDKQAIRDLIAAREAKKGSPAKKKTPAKAKTTPAKTTPIKSPDPKQTVLTPVKKAEFKGDSDDDGAAVPSTSKVPVDPDAEKDNSFRQYRRICAEIAEESSYTGKTKILSEYLKRGSDGDGFKGDVYLLLKLLLPGSVKRVYNLNNKNLIKLFSSIFHVSYQEMLTDLEKGDVAETVKDFFEQSTKLPPSKKSTLSLQDVDAFLDDLATLTKEDEQARALKHISKKSTANDLKMVVRLIKHDLRINAGAKHILEALDPNAYDAFQASRDLRDVVTRVNKNKDDAQGKLGMQKKLSVRASLMTPILPMLAEACKSIGYAFKKCPNGMYAEIKYDGERVQVHKKGNVFNYYSRSLKTVLPHKVQHFKDYIPKAFPGGSDLILDAEVLLIDTKTSKPLPFGTLGKHKKEAFSDANVCLFIFDCIHFNGEDLMDKPIKTRRKFLLENMVEIPNRILFSEMKHITVPSDLNDMLVRVFREGLEGLVLKDVNGTYEPGKRHWLKVKKDYLSEGAMADSADLVVLGAYFGSGNKGGIMSVFLMGCYDPDNDCWKTVTKVSGGHDDKTLDRLQGELDMIKISKDYSKIPSHLKISKAAVPDFITADPKKAPVWEITGAEFSKSDAHTADGISIRFPRVTKIRDDKGWEEATNLKRLKALFKKSKECSDIPDAVGGHKGTPKKGGASPSPSPSPSPTPSPYSTPLKRKADSSPEPSPAKRSKQMCKYGESCYQTNPDHLANFYHTKKTTSDSPVKKSKHLADVFTGLKIYLPESVEKYKELRRFIIAFDGELVEEFDISNATHIVADNGAKNGHAAADAIPSVTTDWLWNCIREKKVVPLTSS